MDRMNVQAAGVPLGLPAEGDALSRLQAQWARCRSDDDTGPEVSVAALMPAFADDHDAIEHTIASMVTRAAIEALAGKRLMLHAAAVTDQHDRAVVLIGPSGAGKTTAAMTLATDGFGYVTDEAVVIDEAGVIAPYPKPLSLVVAGAAAKRQYGPDELGLGATPDAPRAARFVLIARTVGHQPKVEEVALLPGLLEVISHSSSLPALPRPLQQLAEAVTRAGGIHRLIYADIADAVPSFRELLAAPTAAVEPVEVLGAETDGVNSDALKTLPDGGVLAHHQVARRAVLDAIGHDGEVLLMRLDDYPVHLQGIGATIWRALDQVCDVASLTEHCQQVHGSAPEAAALVADAVAALIAADVVGVVDEEAP